ncbi:hypothetical protein LOZ58_000941 [Ophidiomyces ophidiicola]|nr:hypothetical protein LOZ65_002654 [Ophidiomyces ophidiicola]KAI1944046.1 hypothetical protein LOZ66_000634 [Ophidiomyces ophidiicola]KAI1966040.1 hypothetical protein LOZ58_000941 [Ophidiomyces ophidiicola]
MARLFMIAAVLAAPAVSTAVLPRIVGGAKAAEKQFPSIFSLSIGGTHQCGATLLDSKNVLTAAHCVVGNSNAVFRVRGGTTTWKKGGIEVKVKTVVPYPGWDPQTIAHDIALLHLDTAILESDSIKYVKLVSAGHDPAPGSRGTVAGWGLTSSQAKENSEDLNFVTVPIVNRTQCQQIYGGKYTITGEMFCAGENMKDSCRQDSGGPIHDTITNEQMGIVSFGEGCGETGHPGVYTRVGYYKDWIMSNLTPTGTEGVKEVKRK